MKYFRITRSGLIKILEEEVKNLSKITMKKINKWEMFTKEIMLYGKKATIRAGFKNGEKIITEEQVENYIGTGSLQLGFPDLLDKQLNELYQKLK